MGNLFGDSIAGGRGNLQVVKKVVVTVGGKFKDYIDEIQQSYVLGFTPYRLHKNVDGVFVTPIRAYEGRVYVLDDVSTMEVGDRHLETDTIDSKLVYFVKDDGGGGDIVTLQGDRGPAGARGLNGDSGNRGPAVSRGPTGKRGAEGPEGPPGKIGKMGPVGARGGIGACGEKSDKGDTGGVCQQGPVDPQGSTGPRGDQGSRGAAGKIGPKGDQGAPAVEIDIVAELCEQYRRGAYARYAINSMEDIELHDAARVMTIIDKGGRCNTSQSDVTRMATLSKTRVNSNYVLDLQGAFGIPAPCFRRTPPIRVC